MPTFTISSKKPVIILDIDEYEAMRESIELLSNTELIADIEEGRKAFRERKTVSWKTLKKELNGN